MEAEDCRQSLVRMSPQDPGEKRAESGRIRQGGQPQASGRKGSPGKEAGARGTQGLGTHLVQGGVGDGLRREVGTHQALGVQQGKEAQGGKGPGQCHGRMERHLDSGRTGGWRVQ